MLSALAAELAGQRCAAILAMRERLWGQLRPAHEPKDAPASRRLLGHGSGGVSENDLLDFVAHRITIILTPPRPDARHRDPRGFGETRRYAAVGRPLILESFWRCNRAHW